MPGIAIEKKHGSYEIYVDGEFWCTCENMSEVSEEMEYLRDHYRKAVPCDA